MEYRQSHTRMNNYVPIASIFSLMLVLLSFGCNNAEPTELQSTRQQKKHVARTDSIASELKSRSSEINCTFTIAWPRCSL